MKEIALHILDVAHNSVRAKASLIQLSIEEIPDQNLLLFQIEDNGCGMDAEMLQKVCDPFFSTRTTRKIGMGVSLLKQHVELTGGTFTIDSALNEGTKIHAAFVLDHIDRQPLGNVSEIIVMMVSSYVDTDFIYRHKTEKGEYVFDSREIKKVLEGVSLSSPEVMGFLREMIDGNLEELQIRK